MKSFGSRDVKKVASVAEKIYPFAYALFPEELLAHQLVMDGLSRTFLLLTDEDGQESVQEGHYLHEIDWKVVCPHVFYLAQKRVKHCAYLQMPEKLFFKMKFEWRATLFLKYIYVLKPEEICQMLGLELGQYMSYLHDGTNFLVQGKGVKS